MTLAGAVAIGRQAENAATAQGRRVTTIRQARQAARRVVRIQSRALRPLPNNAYRLPNAAGTGLPRGFVAGRVAVGGRNRVGVVQDAQAVALLKRMVHPEADWMGEQVTDAQGRSSRQTIYGDTKRRIRRDFHSPSEWNGDIMLIGPNQYRYYHARANTVDMAVGSVSASDPREARMMEMIRKRQVSAAIVGQETIAGRDAAIVELVSSGQSGNWRARFAIDTQTGIPLRTVIMNAQGNQVSVSALTSVTVGPQAGITNATFDPDSMKNVPIHQLFPEQGFMRSLDETQGKLAFKPQLPTNLPSGFGLTGVWLPGNENGKAGGRAVLLRYGNGVATFSLYERLTNGLNPLPTRPLRRGQFRRNLIRWKSAASGGNLDITYIGSLTPEQVEMIHESLR